MKRLFNSIMSKRSLRILSVTLAVLLVIGGTVGVVSAATGTSNIMPAPPAVSADDSISDVVRFDTGTQTTGKEETVYAITDACGGVQQVIVSDWLKNPEGTDTLADYTELESIENTKGDETYTASADHSCIWNAGGHDIHYQGTTQKQLPVTVGVSYFLNGSAISPQELAGKSGHVTIRFNYTNHQTVSAQVGGTTQQIFVPFLMISGLALDGDAFSNVTVSSGSVFNDGSRSVVVGFALPGLTESLDISDGDFDIPNYVEIQADTTDFSMAGSLTVATTSLFDKVEIENNGDLAQLSDSLNDLEDAALDLVDGTAQLYTGCSALYEKSGDLVDGVSALLGGSNDLKKGTAGLSTGMASMRAGLARLSGSSSSLNEGAKQLVDEVFASATTQLRAELVSSGLMTEAEAANITLTRTSYVTVFGQLSSAATVTAAQAEAQLRGSLSAMTAEQQNLAITIAFDLMTADSGLAYTDAVSRAAHMMSDAAAVQTACAVIDAGWLADASHQALIGQVMGATGTDSTTAAKLAAVALALDSANPAAQISAASTMLSHAAVVATTTASADKITAMCTAIASAATSTGNARLDAVKGQLDEVMRFYNGLLSYTDGVDSAYAGSKELADGASDLADGAGDLYKGVYELYAGSKQLVSGVGELKEGAKTLKDGAQQFYDEGIKKLVDALDGDYQGLADRLCALADAGRNYRSFAGIADGMEGSVKFIYRTDSIGE